MPFRTAINTQYKEGQIEKAITDVTLQLLSNNLLSYINHLDAQPEELDLDLNTLVKNAAALARAAAYKKNVDIRSRTALENGADQLMSYFYEAMAEQDPELYKKVKKFMKAQQKDG